MIDLDSVREKIVGPIFPIITPFLDNETNDIDYDSLGSYIEFLYENGAKVFYVMTYNGRFSLLSWEEMKDLNEFVTKKVKSIDNECVVIVADPMTNPTSVSVDFAKHAEEIGADVISLIFMERYHFDDQVYDHFKTVADSTNIGILIHEQNLDSIRGSIRYPLGLLDRLADIENIIALKEDSKDALFSEKIIDLLSDRLNIVISGRGKRQFIHFNNMGCQSHLVGVGSFAPELSVKFHEAYNANDMKTCWGIINEIERPFFDIGMKYGWHPVLKSAMEEFGLMSRVERAPLCKLPNDQHEEVLSVLSQMKTSKYWTADKTLYVNSFDGVVD